MTPDEIVQELQRYLDYYERGVYSMGEAHVRALELAAFMEPKELLAAIPERVRNELAEIGTRALPLREDFEFFEAVMVLPEGMESYRKLRREREDRQYLGLCRLHQYFSEQKKAGE